MNYLATDKDKGVECLFINGRPIRDIENEHWVSKGGYIILPKGSIKKLIGHDLTWEDEPVEISINIFNYERKGIKERPYCKSCDSYEDGWCTNFGKKVSPSSFCKFYRKTIFEFTCYNCGRKYYFIDSDAICRDKFCCKACEYGY